MTSLEPRTHRKIKRSGATDQPPTQPGTLPSSIIPLSFFPELRETQSSVRGCHQLMYRKPCRRIHNMTCRCCYKLQPGMREKSQVSRPLHYSYTSRLAEAAPRPAQPPRELHVLCHERDALCVDRAQVRVLEQMHEESLSRLLQREDRARLPPQLARSTGRQVGRDFSYLQSQRQLVNIRAAVCHAQRAELTSSPQKPRKEGREGGRESDSLHGRRAVSRSAGPCSSGTCGSRRARRFRDGSDVAAAPHPCPDCLKSVSAPCSGSCAYVARRYSAQALFPGPLGHRSSAARPARAGRRRACSPGSRLCAPSRLLLLSSGAGFVGLRDA